MAGNQIVTLPRALVRQSEVYWAVDWGGQEAPEALNRASQVVRNRAPRVVGHPRLIMHGDAAREFRAIIWSLEGRTNILRMPVVDPLAVDPRIWSAADQAALADGLTFSDGAEFDAGVRWTYSPAVKLVGAVNAGAREIEIDETDAPAPVRVGTFLSFADWPFVVLSREELDRTVRLGVGLLRTAIPDGAAIDLLAHGLFQLDDDMQGQGGYGTDLVLRPSLQITEYLQR